jgi:hypothetical protein
VPDADGDQSTEPNLSEPGEPALLGRQHVHAEPAGPGYRRPAAQRLVRAEQDQRRVGRDDRERLAGEPDRATAGARGDDGDARAEIPEYLSELMAGHILPCGHDIYCVLHGISLSVATVGWKVVERTCSGMRYLESE